MSSSVIQTLILAASLTHAFTKKGFSILKKPTKVVTRTATEVAVNFARTWNRDMGLTGHIVLTRQPHLLGKMGFCRQ